MDALKLIAQDSLKAEVPSFEVGDSVRSKRATEKESRCLREL